AMGVLVNGTFRQRQVTTAARDDLGIRRGRRAILDRAGAAALTRWLPTEITAEALRADARRLATIPAILPESLDDLLLDHAYAREALRLVAADLAQTVHGDQALPPMDLLIGSGGVLAAVPRLMQAALIMLDAVQPEALTQLALDRTTALPLLGHLGATLNQDAVGAALERDGLLNLGLCIAPVGTGKEGETAIKVEVAYATRSPVTVEVPFGAIEVVPLPLGERASLKLWPSRQFDIGLGRGNAATPRAEVEGGAVGIIVDARGRPLALPEQPEKRQAKLLQWLQSTRAYPQLSFIQDRPFSPGDAEEDASLPAAEGE
ncbi:MAG TPA: glutamate mutase L, partial [Chloroflexota bacterium]|nr:glutamate mutase L [Chloroflexota bacterium]